MLKLPNFFIVGAAKAGTTTLYHCLRQHPDIFLPKIKETFYFAGIRKSDFPGPGRDYGKDIIETWEDYIRLFRDCEHEKAIGEVCVAYLYFPETAERIHARIPHARIIIILRNPIERAFSNYLHHVRDGIEPLSFEEALAAEEDRKKKGYWWGFRYIEVGFYYEQVKRYIEVFGRERVAIYLYEKFVQNPEAVVKSILRFLDVDDTIIPKIGRYNISGRPRIQIIQQFIKKPSPIKEGLKILVPREMRYRILQHILKWNLRKEEIRRETRSMLARVYESDIRKLENIIGEKVSDLWLKQSL